MIKMRLLMTLVLALLMLGTMQMSTVAFASESDVLFISEPLTIDFSDLEDESDEAPASEGDEDPALGVGPTFITVGESECVNLRAEPHMDATVLMILATGDRIERLSEEGGWMHVAIGDQTGYVRSDMLDFAPPEEDPAEPQDPELGVGPDDMAVGEDALVNVRAEPSMDAAILTTMTKDAPAERLSEEGGWMHVVVGELTGYVRSDLLDTATDGLESELDEPVRSDLQDVRVNIWSDVDDEARFGDTVTVHCDIENLYGWDHTLQWQYMDESGQWVDIPDAHDTSYGFTLTESNSAFRWRARVDIVIPEGTVAEPS